jgi:hypothetical protein
VSTISLGVVAVDDEEVQLGDGTKFPQRCELLVWSEGWPELRLSIEVHGEQPVLMRLEVQRTVTLARAQGEGPWVGVTDATVHAIPVDEVFRAAVTFMTRLAASRHGGGPIENAVTITPHRRQPITRVLLEQVADVVRGDPLGMPNQAVRQHFHCSARTASRWISEARKVGLLDAVVTTNEQEG